jgi:hypothetical protein
MTGKKKAMKRKDPIRFCVLAVLIGIGFLPALSLQAQEPGFVATFDDPDLPGWEHSPEVFVDDNMLRVPAPGSASHGGEWGDLTLTVRVWHSGEGELVISYRASDGRAYHILLGSDFLALQREAHGAVTDLGNAAPLRISTDETGGWVQVSVEAIGETHAVGLNGQHVLSATDSNPLPPGGVSFKALGEAMGLFDDLVVSSESGTEPPQPHQVHLDAVEPPEGEAGREIELALIGRGFGDARPEVTIGGIEILDAWFESDEVIRARVFIPSDALPGPRPVQVVVTRDDERFVDSLEEGFFVLEPRREPPPPPSPMPLTPVPPTATPSGPDGGDGSGIQDWAWAGATVFLSGMSFAIGRTLAVKSKLTWTEKARLQWRVEAQNKLPEPQKVCQWACQAKVSADLLDRWQVTRLELTPLPLSGGSALWPKHVEGKVLAPVNDLANTGKILHREDEVRRRLAPLVDALLAQLMAWEQEGQTPAAVRVEAKLKAPINAQFGLYHCKQTKGGLAWGKPLVTWKGKLNQPDGEFLGVLRGPTAGEPDFTARARRELEACLLELVSVARFRL